MKVFCPHCGVKGAADESYIGKTVKCPRCEGVFEVSSEGKNTQSEDAQTSVTLPPVELERQDITGSKDGVLLKMLCPHCGVRGAVDESYIGKMVKCPRCEGVFEVFPEEEDSLSENVQTSAMFPPVELDAQIIIDTQEEITPGVEDEYHSDSPDRKDVEKSVSEIDEYVVEDTFPEDMEEDTEWPDRIDESDQEIVHAGDTPVETLLEPEKAEVDFGAGEEAADSEISPASVRGESAGNAYFSIMGVIKDTWRETKGAKASIWIGSCVMYLVMVVVGSGIFLLPALGFDLMTTAGMVTNVMIQILVSVISIVFTAGLLYMGVRKAAGDTISWKMIFKGFSHTSQIILATVFQSILVGLGLLLLVLPGIYLIVGYGLTLPLILDRKMSAWEAMETSRKAIHKVWWKVTGALFLMVIIYAVSAIPLGIGLIWTMPMFIILGGVVYCCLFDVGKDS